MPLHIVATPIGNLQDISARAIQALAEADAILCEDTRRTRELLAALELDTSPKRLHRLDREIARSSAAVLERWIEAIDEGKNVVLVSDAGTPAISDPGAELVRVALERGLEVSPVPGVSAAAALVSVCGFLGDRWVFEGFFPRKSENSESLMALASKGLSPVLIVFFESPNRVSKTASWIAERATVWGVSKVTFAKELTKKHERIFSGLASEVNEAIQREIAQEGERGEWSLAIELMSTNSTGTEESTWLKALKCVLNSGVAPSQAAKAVSQEFGVKKNQVYSAALEMLELSSKNSAKKSEVGD